MNKDGIAARNIFHPAMEAKAGGITLTKLISPFGDTGDPPLVIPPGKFNRITDALATDREGAIHATLMVLPD